MKKLFVLRNKNKDYGCNSEIAIVAIDENEARLIAAENSGCEGRDTWLDENLSSIEEIDMNGVSREIVIDCLEE